MVTRRKKYPISGRVGASFRLAAALCAFGLLDYSAGFAADVAITTASPALENPFVFAEQGRLGATPFVDGAAVELKDGFLMIAGGREATGEIRDAVEVYRKTRDGSWQQLATAHLRTAVTDATKASTADGMIIVGGKNSGEKFSREVTHLAFDPASNQISAKVLSPLPEGRAGAGAYIYQRNLYVGGGASGSGGLARGFWRLALDNPSVTEWQVLPGWPGRGLVNLAMVVQNFGDGDALYVLGGNSNLGPSHSVLEFRFKDSSWRVRADSPGSILANCVTAVGSAHLFVAHDASGVSHGTSFLAFHTITNTWAETPPMKIPGTAVGMAGASDKVLLAMSQRDGSVQFWSGKFPPFKSTLHWFDFGILGLYFAMIFFLAWFFSRKEHTTDDYFRAGKRIPGWAAGISILATRFSAISFMTYPAKSFATNWTYLLHQFIYPLTVFFVIKYIVAFYVRLNVTTAYEYLDLRFGKIVRMVGSLKFVLFELLRMGLLILIPSMILSVIIGVNLSICIILIGTIATLYTRMGGIEGVIWIEVIQFGIILCGTLLSIVVAFRGVPGGFGDLIQIASSQGKTEMVTYGWDFTTLTIWVFLLDIPGAANETVSAQYVVQRIVSVRNVRQAAQSMLVNCLAGPALIFLFFLLGTAIFLFYQANPASLNPGMLKQDELVAWFIAKQLPVGIAGLMIAAIFASTMSSLESSLSSTTSVIITDLYKSQASGKSDQATLSKAKQMTLLAGAFGTISALVLAAFQIRSLLDYVLQVAFFAGGGLAGIFYLGIFTMRANATGVMVGFVFSALTLVALTVFTNLSVFAYNGIGVIVCVIVGYLASLLVPSTGKGLEGLTVHTMKKVTD
jgi:SSS family solute:Na+ symporter